MACRNPVMALCRACSNACLAATPARGALQVNATSDTGDRAMNRRFNTPDDRPKEADVPPGAVNSPARARRLALFSRSRGGLDISSRCPRSIARECTVVNGQKERFTRRASAATPPLNPQNKWPQLEIAFVGRAPNASAPVCLASNDQAWPEETRVALLRLCTEI